MNLLKTKKFSASALILAIIIGANCNTINASVKNDVTNNEITSLKAEKKAKNKKVKAGDVKVGKDFISFEADATKSDLGNWVVRRKGDAKYDQISSKIEANKGTYIEYTTGKNDGFGIKPNTDPLAYKFTPKTSGKYTLTGRMAQQLKQDGGTAKWDQCNDIYIKMEGDFTSGSKASLDQLRNWNKFYGRGFNSWGSFVQIDIHHAKYKAVYNLKAGQEYTFYISARSKGVCIDYFVLSMTPLQSGEKIDISAVNPENIRP